MECKIQIFPAWKVMESGLGAGKSWKMNQIVAAFWTRVRYRSYPHTGYSWGFRGEGHQTTLGWSEPGIFSNYGRDIF